MNEISEQAGRSESANRGRLSPTRWALIVIFGLLSAGFLLRFFQYGFNWVSGAESADLNYKALTIWSLIYVVVCAGIAFAAWRIPAEEDEGSDPT